MYRYGRRVIINELRHGEIRFPRSTPRQNAKIGPVNRHHLEHYNANGITYVAEGKRIIKQR